MEPPTGVAPASGLYKSPAKLPQLQRRIRYVIKLAARSGFEPLTSWLTTKRSA